MERPHKVPLSLHVGALGTLDGSVAAKHRVTPLDSIRDSDAARKGLGMRLLRSAYVTYVTEHIDSAQRPYGMTRGPSSRRRCTGECGWGQREWRSDFRQAENGWRSKSRRRFLVAGTRVTGALVTAIPSASA
jgi:hypothetical protein